jgi:hypothetical protein
MLAWSAISPAFQGPGLSASQRNLGNVIELGRLKSWVPADWMEETPDGAQTYKQYRLEPVNDDKYSAYVTISFPGKGKGGTAEQHVKRWKGMFLPPEGKTMHETAKVRQLTVSGAAVTYLDVRGDYKGILGDNSTPREDWRLLGVYFDTPKGPYLIRLLGPADTVESYRNRFEDWIKGFK